MSLTSTDKAAFHKCLRNILEGRYNEAIVGLAAFEGEEAGRLLVQLANMLSELKTYSLELSKGNLSVPFPTRENYVAMGVKNLHSKLNHLVWQLKQVAEGDYTQEVDYMGELSDGFNWMTKQLRLKRELSEYELTHDKLTGLLTRSAFMRRAFDMVAARPEQAGVMLCCGLDNIKYINDTYGHAIGDICITSAADIFGDLEPFSGVSSRISGDEFAIYLHGQCQQDETMAFTQRLVDVFFKKSEINLNGSNQKIRASYGVAFYPDDAMSVDTLLKYATYAMFEVKNYSKGELLRFNNESYQQKTSLYEKQEKLNALIDEKLIRFAFQPIVDLEDGSIFGYEALMRPLMEDFTSPLEILRLAEAQSKLHQIERITFEVLFEWLSENVGRLNGAKIFFNTVSSHFLKEPALLRVHSDAPKLCRHMVFEILESASEEHEFAGTIASFRERFSCMIAIDDYGCGYSNDMRLISLAPDIVKIDRFFIRDVHRNRDKQHLLASILSFCASKGIKTLAEGVETFEELKKVISLGFRYVQGFYLAEPGFALQPVDAELIREARGAARTE